MFLNNTKRKAAREPASECRPTRAGDLARELAGESRPAGWLAGWLAGELAGELGLASPKNLAIFPIFGDFLLRSYIKSLMIFENHPIFVSTESVLRKIAQTLKDLYYILMKISHLLDIFIKM